jgi:hypothetical protein
MGRDVQTMRTVHSLVYVPPGYPAATPITTFNAAETQPTQISQLPLLEKSSMHELISRTCCMVSLMNPDEADSLFRQDIGETIPRSLTPIASP